MLTLVWAIGLTIGGSIEVTVEHGPIALKAGDVLRIAQAGAGGYGDPLQRPVDDVVADVREGYVSPLAAQRDYGVALECVDGRWLPKAEETARLRLAAQRDLGA